MKWKFYTKVLLLSCALHGSVFAASDAHKNLVLQTQFKGSAADKVAASNAAAALQKLASAGDQIAQKAIAPGVGNLVQQKKAVEWYQQNQIIIKEHVGDLKKLQEEIIKVSAEKKELQEKYDNEIGQGIKQIGVNAQSLQQVLKEMIFLAWSPQAKQIPNTLQGLQDAMNLINAHIAAVNEDSQISSLINYLQFDAQPVQKAVLENAVSMIRDAETLFQNLQTKIKSININSTLKEYFLNSDSGSVSKCFKVVQKVQALLPDGSESNDEYAGKLNNVFKILQQEFQGSEKSASILEALIGGLNIRDSESDIKEGGTLSRIGKSIFWIIAQMAKNPINNQDVSDLVMIRKKLYDFARLILPTPSESKVKDFNWGSIQMPSDLDPNNEFPLQNPPLENYKTVAVELDNYEQAEIMRVINTNPNDQDQVQYTKDFEHNKSLAGAAKNTILKSTTDKIAGRQKLLALFEELKIVLKDIPQKGRIPMIPKKDFVSEGNLIKILDAHANQNKKGITFSEVATSIINNLKSNTEEGIQTIFNSFDKELIVGNNTLPVLHPAYQTALGATLVNELGHALTEYGKKMMPVLQGQSSYDTLKNIVAARRAHVAFLQSLEKINQHIQLIDHAINAEKRQNIQQNQVFLKNLLTQYITQHDNYLTLSSDERMTHFFHALYVLHLDEGWDAGINTVQLKQDLLDAHTAYVAARNAIVAIRPLAANAAQAGGGGTLLSGFDVPLGAAMLGAGGLLPPPPGMGAGGLLPPPPGMGAGGPLPPPPGMGAGALNAVQQLRKEREDWKNFFLEIVNRVDTQVFGSKDAKMKAWNDMLSEWIRTIVQNCESLEQPPLTLQDLRAIADRHVAPPVVP